MKFKPELLPTAIGSMPHKDAYEACYLILRNLKKVPCWPQLPKRSFLENMYTQYSEGMPGVVVDKQREYFYLSTEKAQGELEGFYQNYLGENIEAFAISQSHAAGLHVFLDKIRKEILPEPKLIKGQITGPVSIGLSVTDESKKPILYNETIYDAVVKTLTMKLKWQEKTFKEILPETPTLVFVDEPYLSSFGSAYVNLSREKVISSINEVVSGAEGLVGVHCCGNTDFSIFPETEVDVISFDAYHFATNLALYADSLKDFIQRGGLLAFGIVPNSRKAFDETKKTLSDKLEAGFKLLTNQGVEKEKLVAASFITPSCGAATLSTELSERILELTKDLSDHLRAQYF